MKWVSKVNNAKMIAYSQFPIGADLYILITPKSVVHLDRSHFSGEFGDKYLGMDVRVFIPPDDQEAIPAVLIGSDADPCLAVAVLWDGAIVVTECN